MEIRCFGSEQNVLLGQWVAFLRKHMCVANVQYKKSTAPEAKRTRRI